MAGTQLKPEKITSPFQLMAAWFSMLVLLISVLLAGAGNIDKPDWAAGYLVVFSSIVILVVIVCVTLMLTKFRPHLQEGKEYAEWLKDQGTYSKGYLLESNVATEIIEDAKTEITKRPEIKTKSEILISVLNAVGGLNIVEDLKNIGFNAEIYLLDSDNKLKNISNNQGVWVGRRVAQDIAIKSIKRALKTWPELRYIILSGDRSDPPDYVHDQVFIGGDNSVVKRYSLNAWDRKQLLGLDEGMSIENFHSLIREKYS